ncbi:hypothetical protein H9660_05245 [Clostridium sp. Sa3CUN1]|uniref:Uncharacterized protein n=1 Tax=Clostridium gallinarum TaxID=2762246 RepID=A0ABR8Q2H9_9CLOT|nr:hypothetical protein [Clostridium gallinarum]MBD7914544.1 hypothetical protein [Clostridium gallinarum]
MIYITDEQYEIGIKNGIKKFTIYSRVYHYGWDIEKAITTPPIKRECKARKYPKKYTDLALENGICLITFYARVRKGWSLEDAATVKLLTNRKTGGKKYASSNI